MASISEQIEILQARFTAPKSVKFQTHMEASPKLGLVVAPCCQTAKTVMRSSVIASAAKNGICGVIEYFTNKFSWGCYPCRYFCECFSHSNELFCTATMCVGLEALNILRQQSPAFPAFDLTTVELIIVQCKDVINSSKIDVADARNSHTGKPISSEWLLEDTMYHNLVGIVDSNLHLTVCDYDAEFVFHHNQNLCKARIAAIRVCAWTGGGTERSFLKARNLPAQTVLWSGLKIPLGEWFNIPAQSQHNGMTTQVAALGSVYGGPTPSFMVNSFADSAQCTTVTKKRKFPDMASLSGPVVVSLDSTDSHISTDSLDALAASPLRSLMASPTELSQPTTDTADPTEPPLQPQALPTVLISGIHMGPNPCPGVGVARALRAGCGEAVRLVALDDAQFSDPVFDSLQQVFEMGSTLCSAQASKQRQWDTISRILLEHMRDVDRTSVPFYIPGRDRDIEVAAMGKSAIASIVRHDESTAAVLAAAEPDASPVRDGPPATLSVGVLNGDGGGCIKVTPPTVAELQALSDCLLCPDAAVVELTAKPDIVAATEGPLGRYFRVPEYARLSSEVAAVAVSKTKECADGTVQSQPDDTATSFAESAPSAGNMSLMEMRAFAERIGYPVLLKGPHQGAALCSSWFQLRHIVTTEKWVQNGGFIQRHTKGWEKCLAFAAHEGKLSGCVMMTKASYTDSGKVWSGDLEPVPEELYTALQEFVQTTCWTGGGEIEFIEEVVPSGALNFSSCTVSNTISTPPEFSPGSSVPVTSLAAHIAPSKQLQCKTSSTQPARWVVDFNPRFPAWIFASAYSGCNLPALLLRDALRARQAQQELPLTHIVSAMSLSALSGDSGDIRALDIETIHSRETNGPVRASFVRSVIEIPVVHTMHHRHLPLQQTVVQPPKSKAAANKESGREYQYDVLPHALNELLLRDNDCTDSMDDHACMAQDLRRLTIAVESLQRTQPVQQTPQYVISMPTLEHTLRRLQSAIEASRDTAAANIRSHVSAPRTSARRHGRDAVQVLMCLSVKTQPNTLLLQAAERHGYMAECIDMAEVYHSVLDGGFPWERVVLTGPGKWWDCKPEAERAHELKQHALSTHTATKKFHAIFADSLVDLKVIIRRLQDDSDWLDSDIVGIRWVPLWGPLSRFGLNCKDVKIMREAAEMIAQLPPRFRLGMHFHHACSALGAVQWFGLAQSFSVFCCEFATLCGRPIATLDFGGGFEPNFLESAHAQHQLTALFECVHHTCARSNNLVDTDAVYVQFELGKSVSENAGGVLTRILSIREREDYRGGDKHDDDDDGGCKQGKPGTTPTTDEVHQSDELAVSNALIVDTTVADISTPNSHAVFWVQRLPVLRASQLAEPDTANETPDYYYKCIPLPAGRTEIWGRTCMEWDRIPGAFALPAGAQPGDLLLISGCGAYDMSMQYDFGDGVGRSKNVIVL